MYGLVNKGLEVMIRQQHGDDAWERICADAGVEADSFLEMDAYPDEVTYGLVGAACRRLGVEVDALLDRFGEHWIRFTAREGYGAVFELSGRDLPTLLASLDALHARVAVAFPHFVMPHFSCTREGEGVLRLRYESRREGLAPMVRGLLRGLGIHFGTPVVVEHVVRRADAGFDEFIVHHGAAAR